MPHGERVLDDQVVLLDASGSASGTLAKSAVHTTTTPLHLAFSCYLVDPDGRVLLTCRAETKLTWPGVWTNSCCGHPRPGEAQRDAVRRGVRHELGMTVRSPELLLPGYRYIARMANGIVENEMCPVWRCVAEEKPRPNPAETSAFVWVPWEDLLRRAGQPDSDLSPWCRDQLRLLRDLGSDPLCWPTASFDDLPPAARAAI